MAETVRSLVVDDEDTVRFFMAETLKRDGHEVTTAVSGEEALERLRETPFDLALVDLKLGGRIDGLRVLEAIRWRWPSTAVIILTAHGSLESAVAAIREGVDLYLLKPLEVEELRQGVQEALSRRRKGSVRVADDGGDPYVLRCGPFTVDLDKRQVQVGDQPPELTQREYRLLVHLIENAQRVVPPQELVRVVQDYEPQGVREARDIIKWYVYSLRRKVEPDPSRPRYIVNVREAGYTLGE